MDRAGLVRELARIVGQTLEIEEVTPATSMDTAPEWDSLRHVEILYAVEEAFGLRIEPEDALRLTSVLALADFVAARKGVTA